MNLKDYNVDRSKYINFYNVKEKIFNDNERQYSVFNYGIRTGEPLSIREENKIITTRGESMNPDESIKSSMSRTKSKVYDYSKSNEWEWFVTLTFDETKVDRTNYDDCSNKLSQWLKDVRKRKSPDLKYIVVPEYHEDKKAFHFHGLFSNIGDLELNEAFNTKSGLPIKDRHGNQVYNIGNYKLGFTTATKVRDTKKVSSYITEYITKDLCAVTFNKRRYWNSKNLDTPIVNKHYCEDLKTVKDTLEGMSYREPKEVKLDRLNNIVTFYQIKTNQGNDDIDS